LEKVSLERARAAKVKVLERFGSLAHVVGVGITRVSDDYGVKVNLSAPLGTEMPSEIGGVPIQFEVTGTLIPRL
jgi:hypothetical protein